MIVVMTITMLVASSYSVLATGLHSSKRFKLLYVPNLQQHL